MGDQEYEVDANTNPTTIHVPGNCPHQVWAQGWSVVPGQCGDPGPVPQIPMTGTGTDVCGTSGTGTNFNGTFRGTRPLPIRVWANHIMLFTRLIFQTYIKWCKFKYGFQIFNPYEEPLVFFWCFPGGEMLDTDIPYYFPDGSVQEPGSDWLKDWNNINVELIKIKNREFEINFCTLQVILRKSSTIYLYGWKTNNRFLRPKLKSKFC